MIEFQLTVYMCSHCTRVHNAPQDCLRHEIDEHSKNVVQNPVENPPIPPVSVVETIATTAPFTIKDEPHISVENQEINDESQLSHLNSGGSETSYDHFQLFNNEIYASTSTSTTNTDNKIQRKRDARQKLSQKTPALSSALSSQPTTSSESNFVNQASLEDWPAADPSKQRNVPLKLKESLMPLVMTVEENQPSTSASKSSNGWKSLATGHRPGRDLKTNQLACRLCPKRFTTAPNWSRHMRLVHAPVRVHHPCPYCPATFTRRDNVNAHKRRVHANLLTKPNGDDLANLLNN